MTSICVPPAETTITTDHLDVCLVDVAARLKACRLRLNPGKTWVMWLGYVQQLAKVRLHDVPVLSSQLRVADTVRGTLVSLLIVSCQCLYVLQPSVVDDTISCGNSRDA